MDRSIAYLNGTFLPSNEVVLSPNDLGICRGYGVFDYLRTYDSVPFMVSRHMERFLRSCSALDLELGQSVEELCSLIDRLHGLNGRRDCAFRLIATGGESTDHFSLTGSPSLIILSEELPQMNTDSFLTGVSLITADHLRIFPEAKTTNYAPAIRYSREWKKVGAIDALYTFDGEVLEATRSNFFLVKGNTLVTAKDRILEGITRRLVLELAFPDFDVQVRRMDIAELAEADEAFLTGTTKKITPVVTIDGRPIGAGVPGPKTRELMARFDAFVADYAESRVGTKEVDSINHANLSHPPGVR